MKSGQREREKNQLRRLETLIDSVFALVIFLIAFDLPSPWDSARFDIAGYIVFRIETFIIAALGIVVVLVYWFQSNLLLGNLERTDGRHAAMCLAQILMNLVYLLAVGLGIGAGPDPLVLATQSVTAAFVGLAAAVA